MARNRRNLVPAPVPEAAAVPEPELVPPSTNGSPPNGDYGDYDPAAAQPVEANTGAGPGIGADPTTTPTPEPRIVAVSLPDANPLAGLTEGRMAHYVAALPSGLIVHRPAIITDVKDRRSGTVDLSYFSAAGDYPRNTHPGPLVMLTDVPYEPVATDKVGTWHFIERVG